MKRFTVFVILGIILLGAGVYLLRHGKETPEIKTGISISKAMADSDTAGYLRVLKPKAFIFPEDFGPHTGYKTEWWYFTGNLETKEARHFGYQLTIFRNAVSPGEAHGNSEWRSNQVYFGHFTLTDVKGDKFYSFEKFSRGAQGLAGASAVPFVVWLEDWKIEAMADRQQGPIPELHLKAGQNNISIDLRLSSLKPVVLQGDRGLSQKGPERGNASYYYSLTRLQASGTIHLGDDSYNVTGLSWMDKEWSTSALNRDQAGWDWFSFQLNDGREVMYYQMRLKDGSADPFSSGTLIDKNGSTTHFKKDEVKLIVNGKWQSPMGAVYPSGWRFEIPKENLSLEITPYIKNQELTVSIHYWEGAVQIKGTASGKEISGSGYVELTGYDEVL